VIHFTENLKSENSKLQTTIIDLHSSLKPLYPLLSLPTPNASPDPKLLIQALQNFTTTYQSIESSHHDYVRVLSNRERRLKEEVKESRLREEELKQKVKDQKENLGRCIQIVREVEESNVLSRSSSKIDH
jgi:hypothetical protein